MGLIYELIDPEGKVYIGQHNTDNIKKRINRHMQSYKRYKQNKLLLGGDDDPNAVKGIIWRGCRALYEGFDKHKPGTFTYEVLHEDLDQDQLDEYEDVYIMKNRTLYPLGYNL